MNKMYWNKKIIIITLNLFLASTLFAQVVDVEKLKDIKKNKALKFGGGISANTILYTGNGQIGREPFTYYVNGTLNCRVADLIDIPISFNLTNVGNNFNLPTMPSRLSLHPKYKAVTGHIGDISMSFSPYTLNGYQFRGAGVDVEPKGSLKVSAMAGRLQKATEYDSTNNVIQAAYERFGYGTRIDYSKKLYKVGVIVFAAKDKVNSLQYKPDSLNIHPQQNLVVSWIGSIIPVKDLEISAEYATSALTKDLRDTSVAINSGKNILGNVIDRKNSTAFYKAIKANLNYKYKNSIIGVGYERVDPSYETLGAYYFNNDLENITINLSQPMFKNKGNLTANFGLQKDNLDGSKIGSNKRTVYALNFSYVANEKWITTFSYSNFRTFMFIKPLFLSINQTATPYQNLDTLNYSQVSQNANANINYMLQKSTDKNQTLNLNINYLNAADRQGGLLKFGSASQMLITTASYTLFMLPKQVSFTAAFTTAYNTIAQNKYITLGPTVAATKKLFNKVASSLSASYNTTNNSGTKESSVFNGRLNFDYSYKNKQNFSLSFLNQYRTTKTTGNANDLIVTVGYNYYF
jgi:hypothetical protein